MNEFKRKQWTRIGLSLLALIAATLFLSGIIGGKNLVFSSLETKEASEAGFGGTVTVKAGVKGNKVQKLTVETPDETEGLGKKASEDEFITQFIGKEAPFAHGEDGIEAAALQLRKVDDPGEGDGFLHRDSQSGIHARNSFQRFAKTGHFGLRIVHRCAIIILKSILL